MLWALGLRLCMALDCPFWVISGLFWGQAVPFLPFGFEMGADLYCFPHDFWLQHIAVPLNLLPTTGLS